MLERERQSAPWRRDQFIRPSPRGLALSQDAIIRGGERSGTATRLTHATTGCSTPLHGEKSCQSLGEISVIPIIEALQAALQAALWRAVPQQPLMQASTAATVTTCERDWDISEA